MTAASTLNYVQPASAVKPFHRSIIWTILAIPTCVIPFVNFSCDVSPAGTLYDAARAGIKDLDSWLLTSLALGLCFGLLAFLWRIRLWLPWITTRVERAIVQSITLAGALFFCVPIVISIHKGIGKEIGFAWMMYFVGVFLAAVALFIIRRRNDANAFTLACLLSHFVTTAAFALIEFNDQDKKLGWYLTAVAAQVSIVEIVVLARLTRIKRKPPAPTPAVQAVLDLQRLTQANQAPP